ncbi:MAG: DUF1223 domain-containing protein [Rubrivivax sp.]|nr:DUF1223 domain-containing protein [Rubrivivax sp.]
MRPALPAHFDSNCGLTCGLALSLTLGLVSAVAQAAAPLCTATRSGTAPTMVELYTSEGRSSCPPADRWLSRLKGQPDVVALAFHVDYWDRLGWPDRFALAKGIARQHALARLAGSSQVCTPQVLAQGKDWRGWPQLPAAAASPVALTLTRQGEQVSAVISASAGAPAQLAGY